MLRYLIEVPTRKPRISVVLDDETLAYLEAWAAEDERSVSNLVMFIVKAAIEEREKQQKEKD